MENQNTRCEIIDWRITSRCNNQCKFCYASDPIQSVDSQTKDIIIDQLFKSGCKAVCISGGEPLLDPDVIRVIEELHRKHIDVYLSTNGSEYMSNREKLEPLISKLSLSLDGFDNDSQGINGRNKKSFDDVISILNYYQDHNRKFAIKIGTLLTRKNLDISHFEKMFELLSEYNIDLWKVYEFIPEGRGLKNEDIFAIGAGDKAEFLKHFYKLQTLIQETHRFPCALITREMRDSAYFIVRPDGKVIVPIDSSQGVTEEVIGDLTKEPIEAVLSSWRKIINNIKYNTNIDSRTISRTIPRTNVDDIDKKILFCLDVDPLQDENQLRQSLKNTFNISIGTDVIASKLKALLGSHALYRIMPVVNVANFGLSVFLLNLYFKYSKYMDAEKIGEALACKPYIAWVVQCKEYNSNDDYMIFRISIFAKDALALRKYEDELHESFGELLDTLEIDLVPDKHILGQTYLLERIGEKLAIQSSSDGHIALSTTQEKLSEEEYKVLKAMNGADHLTIKSICSITGFNVNKVRAIINTLLNKKIINKFDVVLDANELGYYVYLILIKFERSSDRAGFEDYMRALPNATHINTLIRGTWDMDIEIRVSQVSTWADIWADIENRFGSEIKAKKLIRIEKEYNFKFLIDTTLEAMENSVVKDLLIPQSNQTIDDRLRRK